MRARHLVRTKLLTVSMTLLLPRVGEVAAASKSTVAMPEPGRSTPVVLGSGISVVLNTARSCACAGAACSSAAHASASGRRARNGATRALCEREAE
jgi:hypothetical protein